MPARTARILPIRRKDFKVPEFLAFVAANGGEVGTPTNPYEVVRYRAYWRGTKTSSVHVVYAKESGLLTWTGGSEGHYRAFLDGARMDELPSVPEAPKAKAAEPRLPKKGGKGKSASRTRAVLRLRDGDDCWFCGKPMGDDCTLEHLIAKAKGGNNSLANYALAHRQCNADAAALPLVEKIAMRTRLHAAQAIEAGAAETGTGSVHESAVPQGCAQTSPEAP